MFFRGRPRKVMNFKEPDYVENPLFTFYSDAVIIVTDDGSELVVETKPSRKKSVKKQTDDDNED